MRYIVIIFGGKTVREGLANNIVKKSMFPTIEDLPWFDIVKELGDTKKEWVEKRLLHTNYILSMNKRQDNKLNNIIILDSNGVNPNSSAESKEAYEGLHILVKKFIREEKLNNLI